MKLQRFVIHPEHIYPVDVLPELPAFQQDRERRRIDLGVPDKTRGIPSFMVVPEPFVFIRQGFISFLDLHKMAGRKKVVGIFVRMVFQHEFPVSLFDLLQAGGGLCFQYSVIILRAHTSSNLVKVT